MVKFEPLLFIYLYCEYINRKNIVEIEQREIVLVISIALLIKKQNKKLIYFLNIKRRVL